MTTAALKLNCLNALVDCYGEKMYVMISVGAYSNGRTAILMTCESGEPFCKLTVNLPDESDITENEFFIKNADPEHMIAEQLATLNLIRLSPKRRDGVSPFNDHYASLWEIV